MAKITPPIPQDKIGENFVWRDWFQRLSDKVFGTISTQDSSNVSITGGTIVVSSLTTDNLYVPTGTDGQVLIGSTSNHSFTPATLTAGANITVTNGAGSITIASTSGSGTVTSVAATVPAFLSVAGSPITTSGTLAISLSGTALPVANGGTGSTTTGGAPFALKAANADITSMSALTGSVGSPTSVQMGNGSVTTLAAGKMWYDEVTGAWNLGMGNGNITQQVGEEIFVYGKASAAITDSPLQIIYHTGTVGASGVIAFAPTIAGITDTNAIVGVATENLALNDFGRATVFGVVRDITTNGTAFGQTWADDDVIWYNPVTGNPTNVEPVAPYIKIQVGTVIKAGSGGSGSFQVSINRGSTLGGTDSNVQFGTLANNNLIAYDSTLGYWKNVASTTLGLVTSVTGTSPIVSSGGTTPAISLAASYGDTQNPYASKTANYILAAPDGTAGVPTFRAVVAADIPTLNQNTTGTATNITATSNSTLTTLSTLSLPGSQVSGNISGNAANVTGTVAIANGGTGNTTATAAFNALSPVTTTGDLIIGNGTNSSTRLAIGANNYVLTSNGTTASWAVVSGSGATISNDTSTATNLYPLFANATSGSLATVYTSNANYLFKPSTGELTSMAMVSSNGIQINSTTIATNYTIATGNNGLSAGPVSINTSVTVTVSTGSRWTVV